MKKPLAILLLLFSFASTQSKPDTVNYNDITIKLGSIVPNFSAQDETGMTRQWIDLNGKKNLVLIFYRGYWWPHCRRQLAELSKMKLPKDTELWAVSIEPSKASASFKKQNGLLGSPISFPLLWDKDHKIIDAFGISDPRYNGNKYEGIPYASTYVISKNRKVSFAHIYLTYSKRPSTKKILSELSALIGEPHQWYWLKEQWQLEHH